MNINTKYQEKVKPELKKEFGLKNVFDAPVIEKIVINMGLAEAASNKDVLEKSMEQLATISGQKPKTTKAKQAISGFSLREGDTIGVMVTLRNKKAWDFLEKLTSVVMPRMRDFRGVSEKRFDAKGNLSLGLTEQILFPEIDYAKIDKIRGLVVTIVIKNSDKKKSKRLLELMGVPFKKD